MKSLLVFVAAASCVGAQTVWAEAPTTAPPAASPANAAGSVGLADANADRLGLFPTANTLRAGQFLFND